MRPELGVRQQVGHSQDRIERGADFVAHTGQELAFGAVRVLRRPALLRQVLIVRAKLSLQDFSSGDVRCDSQKAAGRAFGVVERRCRQAHVHPAAVLAHVRPLPFLRSPVAHVGDEYLESLYRPALLNRKRLPARGHFDRVVERLRGMNARHFAGRVPEHLLGSGVEQPDDPVVAGGDDGNLRRRVHNALKLRPDLLHFVVGAGQFGRPPPDTILEAFVEALDFRFRFLIYRCA